MSAGIYEIVHLETGRKYIGSSMRLEKRWGEHRRDLNRGVHRNRHLQFAWRKYGPDGFVYRVIEVVTCGVDALLEREQWHIDHLGSDGYNLSPTSGSIFGMKLPPVSEAV